MVFSGRQFALCKSNDARSQQDLYDFFKAKVMGFCRRYTSSKEEAEDVFQETFIRVFQNIGQVREVNRLEQWIMKIAVNTAVSHFHKNKRHQHDEERNGYHQTNDEYEIILSQFSDEQLVNLVNTLPEGYRLVFNLHDVEGYSHAEIGELLHISEATSRSQLNRAKQNLKNKLKAIGILRYEKSA